MKIKKIAQNFNIKIFIYFLVIITAIYTLAFTLAFNLKDDGYILADWLINYEDGGFKRRGLSGSFFFIIQDVTGLSLNYIVYFFQFVIISLFFWCYTKLIRYKLTDLLYLSLLLSSIGFVGLLNTVTYVGKKRIYRISFVYLFCIPFRS